MNKRTEWRKFWMKWRNQWRKEKQSVLNEEGNNEWKYEESE